LPCAFFRTRIQLYRPVFVERREPSQRGAALAWLYILFLIDSKSLNSRTLGGNEVEDNRLDLA
jgi:hypothetical protein